jgi:UDPglucose--hexose-1-phosphate uridylyltransferase
MPQLRQNIVTGEWVVIAPERSKRPHDFIAEKPAKKGTENCPFCPEGPSLKTRYKQYDTAHTHLIPNKFPAFINEGDHEVRSYYPESNFYRAKPAIGNHDVQVFTAHEPDLPNMPVAALSDALVSMQKRYTEYRSQDHIEYVLAIYNHGPSAGASLEHPHAQIFASSIVPNYITKELHGSERYLGVKGCCVFCDMIQHEQEEKIRVLAENDHAIMFTFYASRLPFEIWILPKQHQSQFENENNVTIEEVAKLLQKGLQMLNKTLKDPDLNFYIHSLPTNLEGADYYHWHIEIAPRLSIWAGYELGSGMIIDVVSPEKAAEFLLED